MAHDDKRREACRLYGQGLATIEQIVMLLDVDEATVRQWIAECHHRAHEGECGATCETVGTD